MPLPWIFIFFLLFLCFYSVNLYFSTINISSCFYIKSISSSKVVINW